MCYNGALFGARVLRREKQRQRTMRIFSKDLPDLDELVRDFLGRLSGNKGKDKNKNKRAFSRESEERGGGNGFDGGGNNNNNRNRNNNNRGNGGGEEEEGGGFVLPPVQYILMLGAALILFLWVLGGFFTVDASERAVMFRLGKPSGVKTPGLAWHMPVIEDYRIINLLQVRQVEVGYRGATKNKNPRESLMLTGNLNIIDMQFVVQYVLKDARLFLFENRFANRSAEEVVQQVAETAMREVVGENAIDFVLYEGRETVASQTKAAMQSILDDYKTGLQINQVAVQNVQPPDQVQDAFEDAIKARQDRERKINEGEAYANDILPRSRGQAARIISDAEAYRESFIARSQGEADRFLLLASEYEKAPIVTRRRLYLETMETVMARANKVLLDGGGAGNLLYLPLDKLMNAGAAAAAGANRETAPEGQSQTPGSPLKLDDLKNRLRRELSSASGQLEERR